MPMENIVFVLCHHILGEAKQQWHEQLFQKTGINDRYISHEIWNDGCSIHDKLKIKTNHFNDMFSMKHDLPQCISDWSLSRNILFRYFHIWNNALAILATQFLWAYCPSDTLFCVDSNHYEWALVFSYKDIRNYTFN